MFDYMYNSVLLLDFESTTKIFLQTKYYRWCYSYNIKKLKKTGTNNIEDRSGIFGLGGKRYLGVTKKLYKKK